MLQAAERTAAHSLSHFHSTGIRRSHRVLQSHEAVAHPAASGSITADIREGFVVVAVRCTEGHLFNGLIDDEVLHVMHDGKCI